MFLGDLTSLEFALVFAVLGNLYGLYLAIRRKGEFLDILHYFVVCGLVFFIFFFVGHVIYLRLF